MTAAQEASGSGGGRAPRAPLAARPALLIAVVCLIEVLGMAAFATFPALLDRFRAEWAISNTAAGWIAGVYFAGYVAAVAVLTALTDRVDARRIYLVSMALAAIGAAGFASAGGVASASAWRLLQGVGLAGTYMPGLKLLSDALPSRLQSRATAFYTASFGVGTSLSYFLAGQLAGPLGWRLTFVASALGPAVALALAALLLSPAQPPHAPPATGLLDFRPVLANRRALGFTLAYTLHNLELFAFRAWIVAYLVYCQALAPGSIGASWGAASAAALINLVGLPSSVLTNELAARLGRQRTVIAVMVLSALTGAAFGFAAGAEVWLVVAIAFLYGVTITADSSTITAGLVRVAEPRYKGTTMAMHSVIGFLGAILGPLIFGAVLDAAGGATSRLAWGLAFTSMGLLLLAGPLAITRLVGLGEPVR